MRCERVRFYYEEYTQGSLSVATMARVEEHLAACPLCREFYEQSDTIARLIRRSSEVAHPGPQYFEDLNARVLKALDEPAAHSPADPAPLLRIPRAQWQRPLWWVGGMAAAALVMLGLMPQWGAPPAPVQTANPGRPAAPPVMLANLPPAKQPAPALPIPEYQPSGKPATPINLASAAPLPGTTLDKGVAGKARNSSLVEQFISPPGRPDLEPRAENERQSLSDAERKASQETEKRMVSLRQKAQQRDTLPTEVYEQLQLLKTQMIAGGNAGLRRNLRQLEELVSDRMSDQQLDLNSLPMVKQARLYLDAEDALNNGRLDDAFKCYMRIQYVDKSSPLALRASLQMADLFYSDCANFREAEQNYLRCQGPGASEAFTSTEREHIAKQIDRLERYKDGNWQALDLLDRIHRGAWAEVPTALRGLVALGGTETLLPEAARTVIERMDGAQKAPAATTMELYNLLAKRAEVEQNGDIRAWLELALGDMAYAQFQDAPQAINRYRRVVAASETSGAAKLARTKLDKLYDLKLTESVRNRK